VRGVIMNDDDRYYNVLLKFPKTLVDDEMNANITYIMEVTGWTKEYVVNSAFQLGCKWHLKKQLEDIVNYQLGDKSKKL
jgi:hypothetical protein